MTERADHQAAVVERAQRDAEFRARLLADPRAAIAEALGVELPGDVTVRVVEEQPGEAVLVLPTVAPPGEVPDGDLASVAGGSGGSWCGRTYCGFACPHGGSVPGSACPDPRC